MALVLLFLLSTGEGTTQIVPHAKPLTVTELQSSIGTVATLATEAGLRYECHTLLKFGEPLNNPEPVMAQSDPDSLVREIVQSTFTAKFRDDLYEYVVAVGDNAGTVVQRNSDENNLCGKSPVIKDATLVFKDGELCSATRKPRVSTVHLACGASVSILSVVEPRKCEYVIIVGHPKVCGQVAFLQSGAADKTDGVSRFFVEMDENARGEITCQLQNTNYDSPLANALSSVSIIISPPVGANLTLVEVKGHHDHRVPFNVAELETVSTKGSVGVRTTGSFERNLQFLRVIVAEQNLARVHDSLTLET